MSEQSTKVFNTLLEHSEGFTYTDKDFSLPSDMDFLSDSFSVELYNKIKDMESDYPLYLETPFSTTPGYHEEERVFIVKAVPFVEKAVTKKLNDPDLAQVARLQEDLFQDDGDTVYFMNDTIYSGNSSFVLGDRAYENFEEYVNASNNKSGKFGVRFLGMNTPEVPHYSTTPYESNDIKKFQYSEIKNKTNMICSKYYFTNGDIIERKDDDTVVMFYDVQNNTYYEVIEEDYKLVKKAAQKANDSAEEIAKIENTKYLKILTIDDSNPLNVKKGIEASLDVRKLLGDAEDICIMLDHQSLSRQSNHYQSPYDVDYFTYQYSLGATPWKTIASYWGRYHSDARYKYLGFNAWGQDNNKRFLGVIYLKVKVPEMDEVVWINLNKYILQKYSKDAVALPDYTSDPKENMHNGFVSSAFKLWTYDFKNQIMLDAFASYTDDYVRERDRVFEELAGLSMKDIKQYSMILGDNVFIIPPTSIRSMTQVQAERVQLLRSRGTATKQAPISEKMIELKLYFNHEEGINGTPYEVTLPNGQKTTYYMNGLRGLIAQFKLTPFLPIENDYINNVLNVSAVTLMDLQVNTMPGFPKCIQATLTLQEFNYHIYMPELPLPEFMTEDDLNINMFARTIHYPIMRWYYQRLLQKGEAVKHLAFNSPEYIKETYGSNTALLPMDFQNSLVEFYLPDKKFLDRRLQIAQEKESKPIRPYYPLTNEGKELIRQMAPMWKGIMKAYTDSNVKALGKNITDPFIIDYSDKEDYYGHTLYDMENNQPFKNDDGTSSIHDKYTCELTGIPSHMWNTDQTVNYNYEISSAFEKMDFSVENAFYNTSSMVRAYDSMNGGQWPEAKLTGHMNASLALRDYFKEYDQYISTFGTVDVNEGLDKKEERFRFTLNIPMPQILLEQFEREEFQKMVITNLGVADVSDVFSYNSAGAMCVKVNFTIPATIYRIGLTDSSPEDVFVAKGDIELDTEGAGMMFLAYCDRNVKQIILDNGETGYLDYVGDPTQNTTDEAQDMNEHNFLESEDSIKFVKYDFGTDVNIQSISCMYSNSLARVRLNAMDGYAHQFCGGQDSIIEVSLTTKDQGVAGLLQNLPRLAASYVIDYKDILAYWPLRIKSQITKLFGINEVLVEAVDLSTVPNYPGLYTINMRMVSVDRSTRNRETLKKLEDINNAGTITNGAEAEYVNKTYFDLKRTLGKAEIYPDLELPTVDELEYIGYKLTKYYNPLENTRKFLDPDFYYIYAHILNHELFKTGIQEAFSDVSKIETAMDISDKYGALVTIDTNPEKKYPFEPVSKNEVAKIIEETSEDALKASNVASAIDSMNKKGFNDLDNKHKISSKLTQTIAGMKTPMWSITDKLKFPLREEQYKMVYKNDYKEKPEGVYYDHIKTHEDKVYDIINAEFGRVIDLKAIKMDEITQGNFPGQHLTDAGSMLSWAEKRIEKFVSSYNKKRSFIRELCHDSDADPEKRSDYDNSLLRKIIMSYADAATGYAFCEDRSLVLNMSPIPGSTTINTPGSTEEDKQSGVNWKLKTFLNYGPQVYSDKQVLWDTLQPYSKLNGSQYTFAKNVEQAVSEGRSFGAFQIQMYPKASILDLLDSEEERRALLESKLEFVFLDPYYRNLQLNNPNSEELKTYKTNMLIDPAYCAYAYVRNLMVWYKYLVREEIVLSLYETIKATAKDTIFNNSLTGEMAVDLINMATGNDGINEDTLEKDTNATYEKVFAKHAEVFAIAYCVLFDTKNNPEYAEEQGLLETGVPKELAEYIKKAKNSTKSDIENKVKDLENEYKALLDDKKLDQETIEIETNNIKSILKAIGYDIESGKTRDISQEDIVRYGTEITRGYLAKKEESKINNQTFKEIYDQLKEDNDYIISGKLIGLSMLLLRNGGSILASMRNRDTNALDSMMLTLPMPTVNGDKDILRKYMLALDGREALELEFTGVSSQSAEEMIKLYAQERISIERSNNIKAYLKDSFFDMIVNDKRGRMLRAFPTYYMLFIDEGREIGLWKLHDNFYNMNAIAEINVTKSRKIAADTAQITMTNMFKTFTTDDPQRDYEVSEINSVRYNMRDAFNSVFSPRVYAMKEEQMRQMQEPHRTTQLQPGVRVHLRMGYGANAADLPILFNGNIAEVGASDIVDIVAQGDGRELLNPIMDIDDASDIENKEAFFVEKWVDNWLTNGATPKQILTSLLLARGTWLQEYIRKHSHGRFFNNNPYGIVHFGDPEFKDVFASGEVAQNIFEANPRATYGEHEKYSGLEPNYDTSQTPIISMHLLGKTVWDVMHVCASAQPDYVTSIVPFCMRSSIFYGSPRYYYAYDYIQEPLENGGSMIKEKRKPFQQNHIYTSFTDIIHNNIRASAKEIKTNAIGLYQEKKMFGDKVKQVGPLFVDFDIYPEFQKSMTVDTQLWAQGMPVIGNAFGWTADLSKDVSDKGLNPIPGAKEIAWRMTASALKNSMRDMYNGELTVIGDPCVKPYDRMTISDVYERMDGQCEVEAVVHSLNPTTGFTTSIYADCISVIDDKYEEYSNMATQKVLGYLAGAIVANSVGFMFNKSGRPIISSMLKMGTKPLASTANMMQSLGSFLGQTDVEIASKIIRGNDKLMQMSGIGGESAFLSIFSNNVGTNAKHLKAFAGIDPKDFGEVDNYLNNLSKSLDELDNNSMKKEIIKQQSNDKNQSLANQAAKEYDEVIDIKKSELNALLSTDEDLMKSVSKLSQHADLDDEARTIFNSFRTNPNYLSNADNVKDFQRALKMSSNLGDDALDVVRSMKGLMSKSDDVARVLLSVSDDVIAKGGIKALFTSASGVLAAGVWPALILAAIEMAVTALIGGYASEFVYRYMQNLEVLKIYPLKRKGRVMVAGIDGHKGVVVGSPTYGQQGEWTNFMMSLFDGEKGGFIKFLINTYITNDDIVAVTRRLRRENNLPDPQDSNIGIENIRQSINKSVSAIYANNGIYNTREVMMLERIGSFSDDYVDYLKDSYITADYSNSPKSVDVTIYTSPIQSDEEVKKYLDSGFAQIFNMDQSGSVEDVSMNFKGKDIMLKCYKDQQGSWIVPTLRPDAMIVLKDALRILFDELNAASYSDEEDPTPDVFITSATVLGGKMSWENTGYLFRLQVGNPEFTEEDMANFCNKVKQFYDSIGATNFMIAKPVHNNKREAIFAVKPVV